jgi:hypothetical protein
MPFCEFPFSVGVVIYCVCCATCTLQSQQAACGRMFAEILMHKVIAEMGESTRLDVWPHLHLMGKWQKMGRGVS